jgi:hypothetical protein
MLGIVAAISCVVPDSSRLDMAHAGHNQPPFSLESVSHRFPDEGSHMLAVDAFITDDILISRSEDRQSYPDIAYNTDWDEWLVVWQDKREGSWDIWGQLVDAEGVIRSAPRKIAIDQDDYQYPAVAYDGTQNRYLVVWQNSTNPGIYGQVLDADGAALGPVSIITSGAKTRSRPDVAYNPAKDEYLVVWQVAEAAGNHDIWGRRMGVDGTPGPGAAYAISTLAADELAPALIAFPLTSNSAGRYLVAWSNNNPGTYNIVGRRLLPEGGLAGVPFGISTGTDGEEPGDESQPEIAYDSKSDRALVVWQYLPAAGDQEIVGRLIDISETGPGVRGDWLVIDDSAGGQQNPAVAYNGAQDVFVVVWDDNLDMYGSQVEPDLSAAGGRFVICDKRNSQRYGAVASGAGPVLAAWTDYRAGWADVMGQRLSQTGGLLGAEIGLSVADNEQSRPALAYGSAQDEWLVVWQEQRGPEHQRIWGQFVGSDGLLVNEPFEITPLAASFGPDIAYNPVADEFLVVWQMYLVTGDDIYGQRVSAQDRAKAGGVVQIETDPDDQRNPCVSYNHIDDLYLVAWEDMRDAPVEDPSQGNIYGRRLDGGGSFVDGDAFPICARTGDEADPRVAFNPLTGSWLVSWSQDMDSGQGISGQRVTVGSPPLVGNVFDIHLVAGGKVGDHSLACNPNRGVWLSVWEDYRNSPQQVSDLYGRRINGVGNLLGNNDLVISDAAGSQLDPFAAFDPSSDRYTVVWEDFRYGDLGKTGPDIMQQVLAANGTLLFTASDSNAPVFVLTGEQYNPALAKDPADGRALVVWDDWRSMYMEVDIYGRLSDPSESQLAMRVFLPVVLREH